MISILLTLISILWLLWIVPLWAWGCINLFEYYSFGYNILNMILNIISFGYKSKTEIAGLYGNSIFNFLRNLRTVFHSGCTSLPPHEQWAASPFLHILASTCGLFWWQPFWQVHSLWFWLAFHLMMSDVEYLLMYLLAICVSLEKCLFTSFAHFRLFWFCFCCFDFGFGFGFGFLLLSFAIEL